MIHKKTSQRRLEARLYSINDCYSLGFMQAVTGEKRRLGRNIFCSKKAADDQFVQGYLDAFNIGAAE